jgi:hypothetical protein
MVPSRSRRPPGIPTLSHSQGVPTVLAFGNQIVQALQVSQGLTTHMAERMRQNDE